MSDLGVFGHLVFEGGEIRLRAGIMFEDEISTPASEALTGAVQRAGWDFARKDAPATREQVIASLDHLRDVCAALAAGLRADKKPKAKQ